MTDYEAMHVSIVVACRNEIKQIGSLLDSLLSQDMAGISWEAIIADGMSDDGTREVLEEYGARYPQLRFVANPGRDCFDRTERGDPGCARRNHHSYGCPYFLRAELLSALCRDAGPHRRGQCRWPSANAGSGSPGARRGGRISFAFFDWWRQISRRELRRLGRHLALRLLAQANAS